MWACVFICFVSFIYRLCQSCELQITPLLGLVLLGLPLADRATLVIVVNQVTATVERVLCLSLRLGMTLSNFSQNVSVVLALLVIVVTKFSKYKRWCQYFCRSHESCLIPNYRPDSGSHVKGNPALWLAEMHSGLVVNVSDRAGYIKPPRSLVENTTLESPFE